MTLDHSLLQELVHELFNSQQEAQRATNKNYVTRAKRVEQNVEVEIHEQPAQKRRLMSIPIVPIRQIGPTSKATIGGSQPINQNKPVSSPSANGTM